MSNEDIPPPAPSTTTTSEEEPMILPAALSDVLACQFSSWYPIFSNLSTKYKGRSNVTIKSVILDLPDSFIEFLNTDGLILPAHTKTSSVLLESAQPPEWSSDDDEEEDDPEQSSFDFPELNAAIEDAIASLGGSVVPKLNWSSPKDAVWVNSGTLECQTVGDVFLLVKASDFCSFDVHHATADVVVPSASDDDGDGIKDDNVQLQLALRKFCNLYPSQEFRCFVRDRRLIAISQRHHSQHWPHLVADESFRDSIQALIQDFFDAVLSSFIVTMDKYTFDIYIDKKERIWLLDLNVWASRTDALLFTWSELQHMTTTNTVSPVFRVVETAKQVRADPLSSYKAPIDTLHVAGGGGSMTTMTGDDNNAKLFKEFMEMCQRPSALMMDKNSDDEDDVSSDSDDDDDTA